MSLLAGFHGKIENSGVSQQTDCPICHHTTRMRLFWNYDRVDVLCVPVALLNKQCLAVCPQCASVFSLEEAAAQAYQNGNSHFVAAPWLTLLKAGIGPDPSPAGECPQP